MTHRPCPNCGKLVMKANSRLAEISPTRAGHKQFQQIGTVYFHRDGSFCDETLQKLEPIKGRRVFLRMGVEGDPRV